MGRIIVNGESWEIYTYYDDDVSKTASGGWVYVTSYGLRKV